MVFRPLIYLDPQQISGCQDPLEARKLRIFNVGLLDLYQSRAGTGGYPPARLSRGTFMTEGVLLYAVFSLEWMQGPPRPAPCHPHPLHDHRMMW